MLRYVSRRIKDTVERTSNVLEARRTWTYGNEGIGVYDGSKQSSFDQNKYFHRHLDKRAPNSLFEFGLEPNVRKERNVVKKEFCRENVYKIQHRFVASKTTADSGNSSSDKEDFRERIHRKHHCKFQKNFIDALTWVIVLHSSTLLSI